jgi:hypothetical protein
MLGPEIQMKKLALCARSLALLTFLLGLIQCTNPPYLTSIQVLPNAALATYAGQTIQYKAYGAYTRGGGHPTNLQDITNQVDWISSAPSVATINSTGMATAVGTGVTNITASLNGIAATTILQESSSLPANSLTAITVYPITGQPLSTIGEPAQFIAIGSYNTNPMTQDLTDQVSWQSSDVEVATINSAGLALANAGGITTITAIGKSATGASIAGTSTLTVMPPPPPGGNVPLPLLSVYAVGLGTGTVTSSPEGINCISGAGCTGNFVLNSTVTLTAIPAAGSSFGGWSADCLPDTTNTCKIVMSNNEPVGAIFNSP